MSLSFRNRAVPRTLLYAAVLMLCASMASAADYYWQPEFELHAESNTNRDLDTTKKRSSQAYGASAAATLGIATPRSTTDVRPAIRYQDYPDQSNARDIEGGISFATEYRSPRSLFGVFGSVERQDVYNAELAEPRSDTLDPGRVNTNPETGRVDAVGETRDRFYLRPEYGHQFTERFNLGVEAAYEKIEYSLEAPPDVTRSLPPRLDYDYITGGVYPKWEASQRLNIVVGAYGTRYASADDTRKADSVGVSVGVEYDWSESFQAEISLIGERTDIENRFFEPVPGSVPLLTRPAVQSDKIDTFGGRFSLFRRTALTDLQIAAGHVVTPSGGGGLSETDVLNLTLDRRLSERLAFTAAALYYSDRGLGENKGVGGDYANADFGLRWSVTRTWFVSGGYRYLWLKYKGANSGAQNHALFASVGYRGLGRRPR